MKKEYEDFIKLLKKRNLPKYILLVLLFSIIVISLSMIPVQCDTITGGYVSFGGKKVFLKKCWNIYGFELGLADFHE